MLIADIGRLGYDTLPNVTSLMSYEESRRECTGMEHYFCGGECEVVFHTLTWIPAKGHEHLIIGN